jgi:hypothetical protein
MAHIPILKDDSPAIAGADSCRVVEICGHSPNNVRPFFRTGNSLHINK